MCSNRILAFDKHRSECQHPALEGSGSRLVTQNKYTKQTDQAPEMLKSTLRENSKDCSVRGLAFFPIQVEAGGWPDASRRIISSAGFEAGSKLMALASSSYHANRWDSPLLLQTHKRDQCF